MTLTSIRPSIRPTALKLVAASLAFGAFSAAPAFAGSTQMNLAKCKAQLIEGGHVDASTDGVSLKNARRNRIVLEVERNGVERDITCRLSRHEVVALEEDGQVLASRGATDDDMADGSGT